jgi:hypothetical protein
MGYPTRIGGLPSKSSLRGDLILLGVDRTVSGRHFADQKGTSMSDRKEINSDQLKAAFARIEELSRTNLERSCQIRAGIKGFERRLQSLSGKVFCRTSEKDSSGAQVSVSFEQHGSEWRLVVAERRAHQHAGPGLLLIDAEVETQMRAIRMLPMLLEEMIAAHERRASDLDPVLKMIAELGIGAVAMYEDDPKERAA